MYANKSRGLEAPVRRADSTPITCPACGRNALGVSTRGPSTHHLIPCGHRVSALTARDFAAENSYRNYRNSTGNGDRDTQSSETSGENRNRDSTGTARSNVIRGSPFHSRMDESQSVVKDGDSA
ncbi:hypothetical protein FCF25_08865 [Haloprofundus sp. MHR1]|nr:hypothetical protein FCF25_08865 [Haloprofundus sp. MHR1]